MGKRTRVAPHRQPKCCPVHKRFTEWTLVPSSNPDEPTPRPHVLLRALNCQRLINAPTSRLRPPDRTQSTSLDLPDPPIQDPVVSVQFITITFSSSTSSSQLNQRGGQKKEHVFSSSRPSRNILILLSKKTALRNDGRFDIR